METHTSTKSRCRAHLQLEILTSDSMLGTLEESSTSLLTPGTLGWGGEGSPQPRWYCGRALKTLLCQSEHSTKTFPGLLSPLSHPVQVVFQLVFVSSFVEWLVHSGLWVLGFLKSAIAILNVNSWTKCQLHVRHSTVAILWCWLGKHSCIQQECLLSPFHMGRENVQLRPP